MNSISPHDITSSSFTQSLYLTFACILVAGVIKLLWGNTASSKNKMETRQSDAYFRVFTFFLAQPKKDLARKRSFEYMEIGAGERENVEEGEENGKTQQRKNVEDEEENREPQQVEKSLIVSNPKLNDGDEYLACIDTSQIVKIDGLSPHKTVKQSCDASENLHEETSGTPNEACER